MPVRDKAVDTLVSKLTDYESWSAPDEVTAEYDAAYCCMIDHIDWQRVFIEAMGRHLALEHPYDDYSALVCPECVNEALLATDRGGWTDWKTQPIAPRP